MTVGSASWFELLARMAGAGRLPSARGRMRVREPDGDGQVREFDLDFAYQAPDRWRVESRRGPVHVSDGVRSLVWHEGRPRLRAGGAAEVDHPHPVMMLRPPWGDPSSMDPTDVAAKPMSGPRPVRALDRPAHEVTLPPATHATSGLTLVIDDQTGVLLRASDGTGDWALEMLELETGLALPEDLFTLDLDEPTVPAQASRDVDARPPAGSPAEPTPVLPLPRFWPGGLPTHHWEIHADTGAFLAWLHVGASRPGDPATATLLRWPVGMECPWRKAFDGDSDRPAWHETQRGQFQWALVLHGGDLPENDVRAVFDSLP